MIITPYGIFFGLAILTSFSIIGSFDYKLIFIIIISFIIQSKLCKTCNNQYTLASHLSVLPLLLLLIPDCYKLKNIFVAFAIGSFIGRIGCYYVGCCSGNECSKNTPFGINYRNDHFINKKYNKPNITVYPTIFIELISQLIIAIIVYKSEYGVALYGILNMLLIYFSNYWRMEKRMGFNKNMPIYSLLIFSFLAIYKCGKVGNYNLTYNIKTPFIVFAVLVTIMTSNDINFNTLKSF